jgi:hypothetical protein
MKNDNLRLVDWTRRRKTAQVSGYEGARGHALAPGRALVRNAAPNPPRNSSQYIELERAIHYYVSVNCRNPKPFVWTKTADQILESIKRCCMRTANSHTDWDIRVLEIKIYDR